MESKKSITKNYIYNLIYQILIIILPIITTPYISRKLGAQAIGIYGYTISIVTYFTLVGTLGLTNYGKREIAYIQDDSEKKNKLFSELVIFRFIMVVITMIVYFLFILLVDEYKIYYLILTLEIISVALDISWFFQGIEDFKKVVIRNIVVKIISIMLIFVFIKSETDLWKYFCIYVSSTFIGNVTLWINISKYVKLEKIKLKNLKRHLKSTISLFIPQVAVSIYTVLDKTMLGSLCQDISEVGYYEQSQKIIKIALTLVTTIGTVMIPRIASMYAKGNKSQIQIYMQKSFNFVWFLAIPIMFGIVAISSDFVPWFFGDGYDRVITLMMVSSPIIIFISLSTVTGSQFLMSIKKQNIHTIAVIIGAILNVIVNAILIKSYGSLGAVISTVIAEFFIASMEILYLIIKGYIPLRIIFGKSLHYWIAGTIMFIIIWILQNYIEASIISTVIEIFVGMVIYIGILLISKDKFLYEYVVNKILKLKERK